jgi:hypothetical protein
MLSFGTIQGMVSIALMSFLVYRADPNVIRQSPIFDSPVVWKIDIYDTETWNDKDYLPVLDVMHRRITNHANHQQRIESMVKAIADPSRINVKENRRNARNLIKSNTTRQQRILKPNVNQCAEGFAHFLDSACTFSDKITEATIFFR